MSDTIKTEAAPGLLSRQYAATTAGLFALCAFVAFEATAVSTIMPGVAAELQEIVMDADSLHSQNLGPDSRQHLFDGGPRRDITGWILSSIQNRLW